MLYISYFLNFIFLILYYIIYIIFVQICIQQNGINEYKINKLEERLSTLVITILFPEE